MKHVWTPLFLAFVIHLSSSIVCPPEDNCLCLPGQYFEFQCPKNYENNGFIIHLIEHKRIQIDCANGLVQFNINQLPNITLQRIEKFIMRFCPLPEGGFQNVLDRFMIEDVKFFQYSSTWTNLTLSKDYFKGLGFVNSLQLNEAGLEELEDDVFANTPNLTSLDLQKNKLVLTKNLFKYTPKLKTLDLSQNQIDYLPGGLFQDLVRLEVLHFWGNNLTSLDGSTFEGLSNLKSLELSLNLIETVSGDAFKNLSSLLRLNLSKNRFKTLPPDVFGATTKLELVILDGCPLEYLPDDLFSNLSRLQNVSLWNGNLETLPENVFQGSENIKSVILKGNKLKHLPGGLFKGLGKMVKLDASNNKLEGLGDEFAPLMKLKVLLLDDNLISEVGAEVFKNLANLEEISLRRNRIKVIHYRAFYTCENVKRIDLSYNYYSGEREPFPLLENVNNAETINLAHNEITDLDHVINIPNKPSLKLLDLSFNRITSVHITDLQPIAKKLVVNLEHNNITDVSFKDVNLITQDVKDAYSDPSQSYSVVNLAHNPLECDCNNYDLSRYIRDEMAPQVKVMFDIQTHNVVCSSPAELQGQELEKLQPQLLVCPLNDTCPEDCDCYWRPYDSAIVVDCSSRNVSEFPALDWSQVRYFYNQTEMHLEGNELVEGPQKNQSGYDNVTKLHLSSNKIEALTWLPPKLEVLRLDHNNIRNLSYQVLAQLNDSSVNKLTLNGNPWSCDCAATNLTNFLRQHTKMVDARSVRCYNSSLLLRDLNRNNLCYEWQHVYTVLIILFLLLPVFIFFALFSCYKQEIKVWLFAHGWLLFWVTEEELDKDKIYDAFISYSHKDEDFVVQDLLPILDNNYKLCLHYRDWVPGEFITTQVTNSVLQSRRTLVVLSKNFLESVWGKMEFRTAHTQAMTEGLARVIIVLYGDVETESLDDELKTYMKTNTYVKWGDPYFWNKLKYALPHSKPATNSNNNQKIANVMRCIDDKFKLVVPASTPSPGSTPPVLTLDSDELKKSPLSFVSTPPAEAGNLLGSTNM